MLEIPWGLKDILPEEFEKRLYIKEKVRELFSLWGYRELTTPTFEYFSVLSIGVGDDLKSQMIKFIDRNGQIMALRPEFTTSIGRIVATKLTSSLPPFRFFYLDNVFRYPKKKGVNKREIFQTGVELIGETKIRGDAEVISLLATLLKELGIKDYKIIIGSTAFFRALLEEFEIEKEMGSLLKHFLSVRDFVSFYNILDELPKEKRKKLRSIFSIVGDKEILDEVSSIVKTDKTQRALKELKELYRIIGYYGVADSLEFDFSFLRDMDYYTGIVFELFVEGVGYSFAGGGRYDNLLPKMGIDLPATGFALEMGGLLEVLKNGDTLPIREISIVIAPPAFEERAIKFLQENRKKGESLEVKIEEMKREDAVIYARKRGMKKLYFVNTSSDIETIEL